MGLHEKPGPEGKLFFLECGHFLKYFPFHYTQFMTMTDGETSEKGVKGAEQRTRQQHEVAFGNRGQELSDLCVVSQVGILVYEQKAIRTTRTFSSGFSCSARRLQFANEQQTW